MPGMRPAFFKIFFEFPPAAILMWLVLVAVPLLINSIAKHEWKPSMKNARQPVRILKKLYARQPVRILKNYVPAAGRDFEKTICCSSCVRTKRHTAAGYVATSKKK